MNQLNYKPQIELSAAKELLDVYYGVQGVLTPLPGEIDSNFKVETADQLFVFKITKAPFDQNSINFQIQLLDHLKAYGAPQVVPDKKGSLTALFKLSDGSQGILRLLTWVSGTVWSEMNPQSKELRNTLGQHCGYLTHLLQSFSHPHAQRDYEWDIAKSLWVEEYLSLFDEKQKSMILPFIERFKAFQAGYFGLRKSVVHNDANDNNIIVSKSDDQFSEYDVTLIDFGDAVHTQLINDLAICCVYAVMGFEDPLEAALPIVRGYHSAFPITEKELSFLFTLIGMRLVVSVTKAAINRKRNPDNAYLWISEKPAWELLYKWTTLNSDFAEFRFREACGYSPHPSYSNFLDWSQNIKCGFNTLFPTVTAKRITPLDLSFSSSWVGRKNEFNDLDTFQYKIASLQKENPTSLIAGGYLEPRPLYTSPAYDKQGNEGLEKRCVHLGIDFWVPAQTPVHALFDGEVVVSSLDTGDKTYGGLIVLEHNQKNFTFYTLYGHLSHRSIRELKVGTTVKKGACIARIGAASENGNWAPHLHFQIVLSLLDYENDFPGVAYQNEIKTWQSLCPDPNLLFKQKELDSNTKMDSKQIVIDRKMNLGRGMSLQYHDPLHIVRGEGVFLIDQEGRHYLDMVNNVAHVGHEHHQVVRAGQLQMGQLNTNSRYLHQNITKLAKRLTDTLPDSLSVVHFVNSGSEANELALRMISTVTGSDHILASQWGYHGNTNRCIEISSYKFEGKGGRGKPKNTHIFPIPDAFRGKYRGNEAGKAYVKEVEQLIEGLNRKKQLLGGMIIEPIISCGGQIELPDGFLKATFKAVRKVGGLCVVDEVQTGCGRVGSHFWGFQLHDVIPDIVTIGKPLGNGHPVAAVVCTPEIANRFNNGMEFFNTFGGNPVSCAIANEVLTVVEQEKLQLNALKVGNELKKGIERLALIHPIIGSVRGHGLFLGIEFVDENLNPLPEQADYIINRMKTYGVLLSTDGPDHNVIKIKPPLVFSANDTAYFLNYFSKVLEEDGCKNS